MSKGCHFRRVFFFSDNSGNDDENDDEKMRGEYENGNNGNGGATASGKRVFRFWHHDFEVDKKYEPLRPIGRGAYGMVCAAKDLETGHKCAVKKITNAFDNKVDALRTLREIKILRHLKDHENIIILLDIMKPTSRDNFDDVYLVSELMDTDLHQVIRSPQKLSDDHIQYFVYQVLRGLKYIHSANVLHRDLKPSNLLLNASCDLKICDFGLARTRNEAGFMTEYVVTRWYRAPELLLSCEDSKSEYSSAIDMWSVGCIFAELLGRKPLFPGKDYFHQLKLIMQVLGKPSKEDLHFVTSEKVRQYIETLDMEDPDTIQMKFEGQNPLAVDLCEKMLQFNPGKRISVEEALNHPYLQSLHSLNTEPTSMTEFSFDFDDADLSLETIQGMVYDEIMSL